MVVPSPMILAIYASSAVTTVFNIGLIVYQKRRLRSISFGLAGIGDGVRADIADLRAELRDIERRLTALEEKRRLKVAA